MNLSKAQADKIIQIAKQMIELEKNTKVPHPGSIKDPEFKRRDKAVEAAGNRHDRKPTPHTQKALENAIAHREKHIQANPKLKNHLNQLYAHLNSTYGTNHKLYE